MILIGYHAIEGWLASGGKVNQLHLLLRGEDTRANALRALAKKQGLRLTEYKSQERQRWEGECKRQGGSPEEIATAQGVFAQVPDFQYEEFDSLLVKAKASGDQPLLLFLDSITDPQNLGSILRSAAFFGVAGLIITEHRSAPLTPAALKISSGGFAFVPVARVTNLVQSLEMAKEAGFWVVGLSEHATSELSSARLDCPVALVIGNEESGMRQLTEKTCDYTVSLPGGAGGLRSLNAAVATAVGLALVQERQRQMR